MAPLSNRPPIQWVLDTLTTVPAAILGRFDDGTGAYPLLEQLLEASIAWVEDVASTTFEGGQATISKPELYDGNTTNQIITRKRPIISVQNLQVVTPILGYTRVYTPEEIKQYQKQGAIKVFTYKLAVEQALLQSVDFQAWGSLFPPLPQAVQLAYTWGFPQYDPVANTTSYDLWLTSEAGDTRDGEIKNWLTNLQQAAVCDTAACFLAQSAGLGVGLTTSVSFDGYSKGMNPKAFDAQITALIDRRDTLLQRRRRAFYMSSVGGS